MHLVFQRKNQKAASFLGAFYYRGGYLLSGAEELLEGSLQFPRGVYHLKDAPAGHLLLLDEGGEAVGYIIGDKEVRPSLPSIRVGFAQGIDPITRSDTALRQLRALVVAEKITSLLIRSPLPAL